MSTKQLNGGIIVREIPITHIKTPPPPTTTSPTASPSRRQLAVTIASKSSSSPSRASSSFKTATTPTSPKAANGTGIVRELHINVIQSPTTPSTTSNSNNINNKSPIRRIPDKNIYDDYDVDSVLVTATGAPVSSNTTPLVHKTTAITTTTISTSPSPSASSPTTPTNRQAANLTFNKYGFLVPVSAASPAASTTKVEHQESTTSPVQVKKGETPTLSPGAVEPNTTITDDEGGGGEGGAVTSPNMKDYLQNANVEQFSEQLSLETIRKRETKWLDMLANFDKWMERRFDKIKSRCRKGIPQSLRSRAWMYLTGAFLDQKKRPEYYTQCLHNIRNVDIAKYVEDIKKDLHRQFPGHEIFMKKEGRQALFNVLRAYAAHNPEVGYCQAQGPIAAVLLMHMPEEDAFWMLVRISDLYLREYFKPGLEKVQIDGQTLFRLFKRQQPAAYKLMKSQGIDPVLYMTEWFMCMFARTLPWCTVLRVWDMFFCEGVKVLYRVGLYLMTAAFNNGDKKTLQRCTQQGMYETLSLLKNLPVQALGEEKLVRESCESFKISEDDLQKAFAKSKKEFQRQAEELEKRRKGPPPRTATSNKPK